MFNKIQDFVFKVYRVAGRLLIKYSLNPRPSSYPYITGDGFRNLANYIFDNTIKNVDPEKIKNKDIIFVGDNNIKKFFSEIHPRIKESYVLITHIGDENIDDNLAQKIDNKILKWYGINVFVKHPKIIPIPLGIANKHYYVSGIPGVFNGVIRHNYPKKDKIFYGFTVDTNFSEREPALDALKKCPLAETLPKWLNFYKYLHLLATYKFVASPPGSSVEGHRTWDALYIGIVPIVKKSITTEYFKSLGVPLWVVDDWHELDNVNEEILAGKFKEIRMGHNESVLFMDYWADKIKNLKD